MDEKFLPGMAVPVNPGTRQVMEALFNNQYYVYIFYYTGIIKVKKV